MIAAQPLVTIITPSFNQGQYLESTILSVLHQDYPGIEYIIIDGGSNDNSVEIIKKYENKLAYWISEPDCGQTEAIIKGFKKATGQFITWLCSDDILEPSAVRIQVEFLKQFPQYGLVYGDRTRINEKGNIIGFTKYPEFRKYLLKWGLSLPQETILFRKDIYDKTSGLDMNYQMAMDYDLYCKLARITEFGHIPGFLGRFRSHGLSKSTIFSSQLKEKEPEGSLFTELLKINQNHYRHNFPYFIYRNLGLIRKILYYRDKIRSIHRYKLALLNRIS